MNPNTEPYKLKKDSRGRVRFTDSGHRFEIGKKGRIKTYARDNGIEYAHFYPAITENQMNRSDFLRKLAAAIDLART